MSLAVMSSLQLMSTGWGHTGCTALPDTALLWRNFHHIPFLSFLSKIFFPKFQGLPQPKPCTLALVAFPVSPGQWESQGEDSGRKRLSFQCIVYLCPRRQGGPLHILLSWLLKFKIFSVQCVII